MRPPTRRCLCLEVTSGASRFFALVSPRYSYSRFPTLCRSVTVSSISVDSRVFKPQAREGNRHITTNTHACDRPVSLDRRRTAHHSAIPCSPLRRPTRTSRSVDLCSSFTYTTGAVIIFAVIAICCVATVDLRRPPPATTTTTAADPEEAPAIISFPGSMSDQIAPGHVGNLTPEHEEKLRQLWLSFFQLCGVVEDNSNNGSASTDATLSRGKPEAAEVEVQKKRRFGVFKRKGNEKSTASSEATDDDKYGQNKHFQEVLASNSPESIRETFWSMVKHDHPDALALRFLRARKWDVEKALVMLVSTMSWRHSEMKVDSDIMKNGEEGALADAQVGKSDAKKVADDFLAQLRMGKSFLHGVDKQGRPICVVRVRLHRQGEQCEESLERYTVYLIETARMVLRPPVDTATIVFDMTGFSMANMDYTPVKFMIKCFEANYPESLGAVLVHNAPWVFQGIWKIIRGWLDPVVAAKVHFTNNKNELREFIEPTHILKELGGDEDWEYKYVEPVAGENDLMKDIEAKENLTGDRGKLVKEYEDATVQWIHKSEGDSKDVLAKRDDLATQLKVNYWKLDPYLRARSLYDRQGILQGIVGAKWYEAPGTAKAAAVDGNGGLETSINDVD
ncbi:hypothetical protein V8C37DRAFT_413490 [Trichoderma ceciliae]